MNLKLQRHWPAFSVGRGGSCWKQAPHRMALLGQELEQLACPIPCGSHPQPPCCRDPRAAPEQELVLVPSFVCFHHHVGNLSLLVVTDAPDPQWDSNHFNSSRNSHLAIIFSSVCVFLGSTSATFQSRTQSQQFPTAFKTSGTFMKWQDWALLSDFAGSWK